MTLMIPFDNELARLGAPFTTPQPPSPVAAPQLLAFNTDLAAQLGITPGDPAELAQVFGGNRLPDGATPVAHLYSGHQFGNYNPQLGDGRAVLLGETLGPDGQRRDIQLKGAGRTPYSRGGDGRAWLGPVLREYVISEAMHALGVPTTRALAAVATGEAVYREHPLPGAVLTRVAASHLRVGSFQVLAARGDIANLRRLTDYAIARHYPQAEGVMGLLRAVCDAQARLVAQWMGLGFIHGVMNTDNCAISGETIDYGPCAFLDVYHPQTVFSSIDRMGRYAYDAQPDIVVWNMAQFATALLAQLDDPHAGVEEATEIVHAMPRLLSRYRLDVFRAKLGLTNQAEGDAQLIEDLLQLMQDGQGDFTNTFRALGTPQARDQVTDPQAFDVWESRWRARIADPSDLRARIRAANPAVIPRNHRMEEMITAAVEGDFAPFHRLNRVLARPFEVDPQDSELRRPPTSDQVVQATFCGT